jgi:hypothetical protein
MKPNDLGVGAAGIALAMSLSRMGRRIEDMRDDEITQVGRPQAKPDPSDIDDAVAWLTEHVGFPARSKKDLESRRRKRAA